MVGAIIELLKFIFKSSEIFDKLITTNCVVRSLKLTKLYVPPLAILLRSPLSEEIVSIREVSLELVEGCLGNRVEECKLEPSVKQWIGLSVTFNGSLMKIWKKFGHKKPPYRTSLLIG